MVAITKTAEVDGNEVEGIDEAPALVVATQAPQPKQRLASDWLFDGFYRYDQTFTVDETTGELVHIHQNLKEEYDCGVGPMKVSLYDTIAQDRSFFQGTPAQIVSQKRQRYFDRSMQRASRVEAMAGIVGKRLVCSDPACKQRVNTGTKDAQGKDVWVDSTDTTPVNTCWHVSAVYMLQQTFLAFARARSAMVKAQKEAVDAVIIEGQS